MRSALFSLLMVVAIVPAASRVTNEELSFSVAIPEGFVTDPDGTGHASILYSWVEEKPTSASGRIVVSVQRLNGTLGRERMSEDTLHAMGLTPAQFRWKSFDIDGARQVTDQDGLRIRMIFARVPLRREAIQLLVAAPESQADRAEALMNATLASLEGESNWLTDEQRAERLGHAAGRMIGWPLLIILAIVFVRRRNRKTRASRAAA